MKSIRFFIYFFCLVSFFCVSLSVGEMNGQKRSPAKTEAAREMDTLLYSGLRYRHIGPYRGGRSAAVTGVTGSPGTYYFGGTGGGVWKSTDGGNSWQNISDGFFGGSMGAVAVAESDPNVVYAGGGEKTVRGNVSHGYGIWKSEDAGETWKYCGLKEGQFIPRIRIHPSNPDVVYAAVLGHIFGPNPERGVYRSLDGGKTWKNILFVSHEAGAVDLVMDPSNPRNLYATTWQVIRTPYSLESGGPGSGLWKSTDGGDSWVNLSETPGMPPGPLGIIGVTVSPLNTKRLWAMVEAHEGGLFRSEDGGQSWTRVNSDRNLRQRAWYYTRVYADPGDADGVYVLNVSFHYSKDGGKSFERISTPHPDHHDLWINPLDPQTMIVGDDGGAQVSVNRGKNWTTYHNQPTAQFYRVTTDNHFPYRIYAAQQDNSTIRILHRSTGWSGITEEHWEATAGGESGHLAPDPRDPEIVYGGSYGGYLQRLNHRTGERRQVDPWPDNPMGSGAGANKYRFQWNFPLFFSRHVPGRLYCAANVLFVTENEGQSWEVISPDLTRNDPSKLGPSGGPITKDNTSVEYYGTIFAADESVHEPGVLWTGSDDGLIHLSMDAGKTWKNVTPPASVLPEWTMINSIEPHPFEKGGLYVAATAYKLDDFTPYILKTTDYGRTWERITAGIDPMHFTRVVRADPARPGLLYAGTESGMYISFNDGKRWSPFQLNLPVVPITDLTIKENDLIVATQGRSLWVLDDLTLLHQLDPGQADKPFHFYQPRPAYRIQAGRGRSGAGENPPNGPVFAVFLKEKPGPDKTVRLEILDREGQLVRSFDSGHPEEQQGHDAVVGRLEISQGMNRIAWDMVYPGSKSFPGLIMWAGSTRGPLAPPGEYRARLVVGTDTANTNFQIKNIPGAGARDEDLKEQFLFFLSVRDKLSETHQAILDIRNIRSQLDALDGKAGEGAEELKKLIAEVKNEITGIEEELYQTRNQSPQDPLNYPIRLNNKLAALGGSVSWSDFRPTGQAYEVKKVLEEAIDKELQKLSNVRQQKLAEINRMAGELQVPAVVW